MDISNYVYLLRLVHQLPPAMGLYDQALAASHTHTYIG